MRTWKMAAIVVFAGMVATGSSLAQQPQSIKLVYDVHFGGLKIGNAELEGKIGPTDYRVKTRLKTAGMVEAFYAATVRGVSEGVLDESGAPLPSRFRADAKTSKKDQMVEIVYRDGAPSIAKAKPAFKKKSYEIVPEKQVGAIDPLSAALHALAPAPASEACDSRIDVFDGRKRWTLTLSNPRIKDDRILCDGVYERIAGFKPKHMRRQTHFPFDVTYTVDNAGLAVVRRITVETDFGHGVATLRRPAPKS